LVLRRLGRRRGTTWSVVERASRLVTVDDAWRPYLGVDLVVDGVDVLEYRVLLNAGGTDAYLLAHRHACDLEFLGHLEPGEIFARPRRGVAHGHTAPTRTSDLIARRSSIAA
jgi:hypothetical protein